MAPTKRLELLYLSLDEIKPYDKNPRDNSAAIDAVARSIEEYGFRVPLVIDSECVIVTGHTRYEAAKKLKLEDIPCFVANDLTPEQIAAFRLVDNKTAELATWDFDLLAGEIATLAEVGIDLTGFGWSSEEIDCLREVVQAEAMDSENITELASKIEADGINGVIVSKRFASGHITHDALSVRISVGEFNFFIATEDYRVFAEAIRKKNNYDRQAIVYDLAERLGMLKEAQSHDRRSIAKAAEKSGKMKEEMTKRLTTEQATTAVKRKQGKKVTKGEELHEAGIATNAAEAAVVAETKPARTRARKPVAEPVAEQQPTADASVAAAPRTRTRAAPATA